MIKISVMDIKINKKMKMNMKMKILISKLRQAPSDLGQNSDASQRLAFTFMENTKGDDLQEKNQLKILTKKIN